MVNAGVALLIALTAILTIAVVAALIWAAIESSSHQGATGGSGPTGLPPCRQTVVFDSLLQIPDDAPRCVQEGVTGSLFYIGNLGMGTYDFVVAPWGTQPLDVCVRFCTRFIGGTCIGPNYNGQSAQTNFNQCMQQLAGTGCSPPLPIAARGPILYYALSPTCNICDDCGTPTPLIQNSRNTINNIT